MKKIIKAKKQKGIALLVVTMMIALLSTLVIQMTHSTFLQSRSLGMLERNVQAEYLLKSALNIAAAMIDQDQTPTVDSYALDTWGIFKSGAPVPQDMLRQLGVNFLGLELSIEIVPENAKLYITDQNMLSAATARDIQTQVFTLFDKLDFDGVLAQADHTGLTSTTITKHGLVSNLIDYLDADTISYSPPMPLNNGEQLLNGIEANLPKDYFPKSIDYNNIRMQDLIIIPGMTPDRLKALIPYARTNLTTTSNVNINVAPSIVLQCLDINISPLIADQIITYRDQNQAFKSVGELNSNFSLSLGGGASTDSERFEFIGKVRFGDTKAQYLKAIIDNSVTPSKLMELTFY